MTGQIDIKLPDSSVINADKGSKLYDAIGIIGKGLQQSSIAAKVDGELVDLSYVLDKNISLEVITFKSDDGRDIFWHSASHLMAQAIRKLYPEAKFAIGPSVDNGFYYDIDMKHSLIPEDLEKIEEEMKKLVEEKIDISCEEMSREDAIKRFSSIDEVYKVELLEEIKEDKVTIYSQGEFFDLCRGPHVLNTSYIKSFKLLSIAGAYWRGDEKNKMLQRIYGVAFPEKKALKKHLNMLEEAKKRDHRKLGNELDLFSFSEKVGAGLPLWHPNGAILRHVLEKFAIAEHLKRGYKLYNVPHIAKADLYETSGHLNFYSENMYSPIKIDGQDYYIKPMNCPSHIQIFNHSIKSYRELPYRTFEMGTVYRYERSGVLHGLTRVRGFTQDDAHILCTEDQIESEIGEVLKFTLDILKVFGFTDINIYLSTRPEKSVGTDENWEIATNALKNALERDSIDYKVDPGEGVFYGPKIDVKIKDAIGREWQCSTIQVDFNLPEKFEINYIGTDGQKHRPIMIHRALMGSLERFIGILIEHYSGKFPIWFAPIQMILISVSDAQADYIIEKKNDLLAQELRVEIDLRNESIGYKIRDAISKKVPYICVIGDKEIEEGNISVRKRGENKSAPMKYEEFIKMVNTEISDKI